MKADRIVHFKDVTGNGTTTTSLVSLLEEFFNWEIWVMGVSADRLRGILFPGTDLW